jgi:hypothetical protein
MLLGRLHVVGPTGEGEAVHGLASPQNWPQLLMLYEPFPVERQAIKIEGFAEVSRTFGECRCYRIKLNGIDAAVVRPEKSRYPPELIEVIAPSAEA